MERFETTRIKDGMKSCSFGSLTEEIPLTIEAGGKELVTLLASPVDLEDLVRGFLFTSGIVSDMSAMKSLVVDSERCRAVVDMEGYDMDLPFRRVYTSGCGKGVIFHNPMDVMNRSPIGSGFTVSGQKLFLLMKEFLRSSDEHSATGGVHSAALASGEEILVFRDDIGRHNAIDKVIGHALPRGWSLTDKMVLTTGRISSEILSKILRCRIPLISAAGSPTNQAVKLARVANLTLARLDRGGITAYSGEARIIGSDTPRGVHCTALSNSATGSS